jgi:hypothetical protein
VLTPTVSHWNGTTWTATGVNGAAYGALSAVTCATATACWAVGADSAAGHPVVATGDGAAWTAGGVASTNGALTGVSCPTSTGCWAVGYRNSGLIGQTLAAGYGGGAADPEPVVPEAPYLPLLLLGGVLLGTVVVRRSARA